MLKNKQSIQAFDKYILLPVIFGVVTTLVSYSGYGTGNHVEQLPIIIRFLDKDYLSNDFFVNASTLSIARHYFATLIAFFANSEDNLPLVFIVLTLLSNVSSSVITYKFANDLFTRSPYVGLYASALVMSISTFDIAGIGSVLYARTLVPGTIALPLALASIWSFVRGKIPIAIIFSGLASVFHPLVGLEIGGILITTYFSFNLLNRHHKINFHLQTGILCLTLYSIFLLLSILPQLWQPKIHSEVFIYTVAYFRHPHHYLPSPFSVTSYINTIAFICTFFILFVHWNSKQAQPYGIAIATIVCIILLLCIGGYIFVEIWPLRLWVTAQTFRLLFIVNWIGLIFVANMLTQTNLSIFTKILSSVSLVNPLSLSFAASSHLFEDWSLNKYQRFGAILLLMVISTCIYFLPVSLLSIILFSFYIVLILMLNKLSKKNFILALASGSLVIIFIIFYQNKFDFIDYQDNINNIKSNFAFQIKSELGSESDEVVKFVKENTPDDAIFLTPPTWGQFRLLAKRAIVVDFKAFPFFDIAIEEWYNRIINCYGKPIKTGFAMVNELNTNYLNINDDTILIIKNNYNVSYAVLYVQTLTSYEVVFHNEAYKVIQLNNK